MTTLVPQLSSGKSEVHFINMMGGWGGGELGGNWGGDSFVLCVLFSAGLDCSQVRLSLETSETMSCSFQYFCVYFYGVCHSDIGVWLRVRALWIVCTELCAEVFCVLRCDLPNGEDFDQSYRQGSNQRLPPNSRRMPSDVKIHLRRYR